jgi:hypothetical protein
VNKNELTEIRHGDFPDGEYETTWWLESKLIRVDGSSGPLQVGDLVRTSHGYEGWVWTVAQVRMCELFRWDPVESVWRQEPYVASADLTKVGEGGDLPPM